MSQVAAPQGGHLAQAGGYQGAQVPAVTSAEELRQFGQDLVAVKFSPDVRSTMERVYVPPSAVTLAAGQACGSGAVVLRPDRETG